MAEAKKKQNLISDIVNVIPSEKKVLLLSSPFIIDRIKSKDIETLNIEDINWNSAVDTIFKYGLSGIIFSNLKNSGLIDILPEEGKLKLQHLYHSNAARNALITQILNTISQLLEQEGKPFLLLQGTALISGIYPKAAMRYLSDMDIMIKIKDAEEIDRILKENGFTATTFPGTLNWCIENINHLPHYYYPGFNSPLEVHFKTAETFSGVVDDKEWIWDGNTRVSEINNLKIPSPENLLLSISAHIAKKSHIADLRFIPRHSCDIYALMEKYAGFVDRKILFKNASNLNLLDPLCYSLTISEIFFPSKIITELSEECRQMASEASIKLGETVTKFLLCEKSEEILLDGWMTFFNKPGVLGKIYFILSHIFPRPERMRDIYGVDAKGMKLISCYLLRPFHLINRFSFSRIKFSSRIAETKKKA